MPEIAKPPALRQKILQFIEFLKAYIDLKVWSGVLIVFAAGAAYCNTLHAPFLFDDVRSITDNPTIRHFWSSQIWMPPLHGEGVSGRPLVNFSLALNYAISGTEVWSYHALNLVIHALAGLTLFGIVRHTLLRPLLRVRFGAASLQLALAVAALWTVHPLQTESVTCTIQRTESLAALFYLLSLYGFIRGVEASRPAPWFAVSISACLLGMGSKETMVSAPLMVLLYDRTFVAGTFREAWRARRRFYAGLAATWLLLGALVINSGGARGETAGFGLGITSWTYALTQCQAIVHYLWLAVWPYPLVVDYGTDVVTSASDVLPQALFLLSLVAGTLVALRRRPVAGFVGCWFFVLLAPSSSVIPLVGQTVAEHRMYLPLVSVIVLIVVGVHSLAGRAGPIIYLLLATTLGVMTLLRNTDYRSELSIWQDTVTHRPDNPRAQYNLGLTLAREGRDAEAINHYEEALRLQPNYPKVRNNLGIALANSGRISEAIANFTELLRLDPNDADAHNNLGSALAQSGRMADAIEHFQAALRLQPNNISAQNNLAAALLLGTQ